MHSVSQAATAMTLASGLEGVVTPVHAGAQTFWIEQGKTLTDDQK